MSQLLLDLGNGLARIQVLGTDLGTVHNGMTTVQFKGVVQILQSLFCLAIAGILNPPVGLHQDGRSQVLVGVPPVTGTGRRTASTKNAFVHTIQLCTVLLALKRLLTS